MFSVVYFMSKHEQVKYRVGVLMGGLSIEREVSFNSGRTICDHLDTSKFDVIPLFQDEDGCVYFLPIYFLHRGKISDFQSRLAGEAVAISWDQLKDKVDFVYIAQHGRFGEDGILQGVLEVLQIPYLGAKVFGSALGMEKAKQKEVLRQHGIMVPKDVVVRGCDANVLKIDELLASLVSRGISFPVIVKPSHEGSSCGITVVETEQELISAIKKAATVDTKFFQDVLIEEKIVGMEFVNVSLEKIKKTNGVVISEWFSFPLTEVICEEGKDFFDYEQKYMPGRATKITPARCSDMIQDEVFQVCHQVAKALNFCTIARIDGFVKPNGDVVIIDPNTLTGMGPATFLFNQAAEFGMNHTQLINYLIETEMKRYGMVPVDEDENRMFQGGVMDKELHLKGNTKKMRVAVLLGGASNEREISLESGRNVCYKLSPHKYDVIPLFLDQSMKLHSISQKLLIKNSTREITELLTPEMLVGWSTLPALCDFVFIGLHGGHGENGAVQGMLEMLGVPYNGSGVLTSALCMDKYKANSFLGTKGFDVPKSMLIEKDSWLLRKEEVLFALTSQSFGGGSAFPCIAKPSDDGCSVMVSKIENAEELEQAITALFENGKSAALIEEVVQGIELTCGVYGNDAAIALPPSQTIAKKGILSIHEKFLPGDGQNITPALISSEAMSLVRDVMQRCYMALGCKGYSRIDCFYQDATISQTGKDRVVILEINTLPALTPATCLFHQAAEIGIKPMDFFDTVVTLGLQQHGELIAEIIEEKYCEEVASAYSVDIFANKEEVDEDNKEQKDSKILNLFS